jgi:two-component sensor histidine kinase
MAGVGMSHPLVLGDRDMLMDHNPDRDEQVDAIDVQSEDALREMLFRELHHRFYNSLQAISVMAGTTIRRGATPEMLRALQDRIGALARIQRLLAEPVEANVSLAPACEALCADLLRAFDREDSLVEVRMDAFGGDPIIGRGILLLVVELVTNALKHARSGTPQRITISLAGAAKGFELVVRNTGSDATSAVAAKPAIAKSLARCLGGALAVRVGSDFEVRVALPMRRIAPPAPGTRPLALASAREGIPA